MRDNNMRRYRAFIAYAHTDRVIGTRLFRKLDRYRPPKELHGRESTYGPVPDKLHPIFRDREELSTSDDVARTLRAALAKSDNLVVVCSPAAAASRWVNEEIRQFCQLGRQQHIHAVLAKGEPGESFPPAFKEYGLHEPLAADLRNGGDGWYQGTLKLIAGLLGVNLGELQNREQIRRFRWIAWSTAISSLVAVMLAIFGAVAVIKAREAERNLVESLVQQGQREASEGDLLTARNSFVRALGFGDTTLGRAGVISTLSVPLDPNSWFYVHVAGEQPAKLTAVSFIGEDRLVVADQAGTIRLFELNQNHELWSLTLDEGVRALSYPGRGDLLSAGTDGGKLHTIALSTGLSKAAKSLTGPVMALRHDATGEQLAVGIRGGVIVFDANGEGVFDLIHDHAGTVQGLAFNHAGDHLYWGGSSSALWYCRVSADCDRMIGVEEWVYAIDGSPSGRFTAYSEGGDVEFFDHYMQQRNRLASTTGHVYVVRFDPTGRLLALAGSNRLLTIYDVRARRLLFTDRSHRGEIYDVDFSPSGKKLSTVGMDGLVTLWNVDIMGAVVPPHSFEPSGNMLAARQRNRISDIRVTRNKVAAVSTWDQQLRVLAYEPGGGGEIEPNESTFADQMALSLDLARTSSWKLQDFSPRQIWAVGLPIGEDRVDDAVAQWSETVAHTLVSRDRSSLGFVADSGAAFVILRDAPGVKRLQFSRDKPVSVIFSGSNDKLVAGYRDGEIWAIDIETGTRIFSTPCGDSPIRFLFSRAQDDSLIAANADGLVCLFDLRGHEIFRRDVLETDTMALSPDGTMLATAGLTGKIRLLKVDGLIEIGQFDGHRGSVDALHFTSSGDRLLSGGADETLRVWPAQKALFVSTASIDGLRQVYPSLEPSPRGLERFFSSLFRTRSQER